MRPHVHPDAYDAAPDYFDALRLSAPAEAPPFWIVAPGFGLIVDNAPATGAASYFADEATRILAEAVRLETIAAATRALADALAQAALIAYGRECAAATEAEGMQAAAAFAEAIAACNRARQT